MRVAIAHDYFDKMGGGERLMLSLARALKADVYTGFIDYNKTFDTSGIRIISLGVSKKKPQLLRNMEIAKKFEKYNFPEYDVYIFSGAWCISAAHSHPSILYCHTPPRYMYDLEGHFLRKSNIIKRQVLKKMIGKWKPKNQHYMGQFDVICANSQNVKNRIRKFYGDDVYKKCIVVHPGIDTKKFYCKESEGFFLSTSRLDSLKRIDMVIEAFKEMPDKKLVVVGSGPDEKRLKKLAQGSNIKFVGRVPEKELISLYARCTATIVAAIDEDFGMVSIESQAAGKPVIAVNEGGLLENVVAGKTGIFFEPDAKSLVNAIEKCEKTKWNHKLIQKNAKKYDISVFVRKMRSVCEKIIGG